MALDLLIRGGTVIDGTGAPRFTADVGIADGRIAEIGRTSSRAKRVIDADGLIVSPGFVDLHTHMDAQVMWDPLGTCSCYHGVTSVAMSNCGFTLAPCKPADRQWYADSLSYVEDISVEAMAAGIEWTWETFPEYMAAVERRPMALNHAMYIGHSALRMYVMGRRSLTDEATPEEVARMAAIVQDALRAGAIGFSTSRTHTHLTPDGSPVASRIATWDEIERIVAAMAEIDAGIVQSGPDLSSYRGNVEFLGKMRHFALDHGRPVMFGIIGTRQGAEPASWQIQAKLIKDVNDAGGRMYGQSSTRSINATFSMKSYLPFDNLAEWKAIRGLPIEAQKARMRDPETRRKLVAAEANMKPRDNVMQGGGAATTDPRKPDYGNLFALVGVDWNDPTIAQLAAERGAHPVEVMIDLMLENEDQIFIQPINNENPDDILGILTHDFCLPTFSDSGAHVAQEIGSLLQTHFLRYWVNLRGAFTMEQAVKKLAHDNARAGGFEGRGVLKEGYHADVVLFDEKGVKPSMPRIEHDLPGGARRLKLEAEGIEKTIVNGVVTLEAGQPTGDHGGVVIRGRPGRP
ncbi:MAG: amidohydrolase family protein [Ectothiorhodospiraceae bacterium]|nr:amidohydrolase family protein [Ectothiorhodospiraceae bacterium]